ncbi:MAG TPA: FKBP-type peptidyl-prolyl cis-trans isomerase [Nitrospiraceae bacterium]|nr:FKBP-type peptidyl-prolyl cis-trans isomerase [Nitrospiraceae bacterium]
MGTPHRIMVVIVSLATFLMCLGLLWNQTAGAESPRITNGSNVTALYKITGPGECGLEIRVLGKFVQGQHQLLPAFERAVTGMKTGDEIKVELPAEEGFGPYDAKKRKIVPISELPAWTQEGDVLQDRAGQQATVTQLSDSSAVMDYNHPLAGKPLNMKIRILRVDDPS